MQIFLLPSFQGVPHWSEEVSQDRVRARCKHSIAQDRQYIGAESQWSADGIENILVLYTVSGDEWKKTRWVMHQYRLSDDEDEMEGELVTCKIYYRAEEARKKRC